MSEMDIGRIFDKLEDHGKILARIEERFNALPCDRHTKFIEGDGNGNPGAKVKIDRIERTTGTVRKIALWIGAGLFTAAGAAVWALLQAGLK